MTSPPQEIKFSCKVDSRYGAGISNKIRTLEKSKIKLVKECNHVTYLTKCKNENVIPKGLLLKTPYHSYRAKQITKAASSKLVKDRLYYHMSRKLKLMNKVNDLTLELSNAIGLEFEFIEKNINKSASRQNIKCKSNHTKKFEKLKIDQIYTPDNSRHTVENPRSTTEPGVINLSNKELTPGETQLLAKGLNYAVAPKRVNTLDFITGIESVTTQLPDEVADEFRCEASIALKKTKDPEPNLSKMEQTALNTLKSDSSIKILPADKGNATVVLDCTQYDQKIDETLKAGKYTLLNKNPTKSLETKIEKTLRKHKQYFSDKLRTKLTPHHSKTPHLYGLPKVHKENVPLRPIVSSRDSPTRELCNYLLPILKPLAGNTDSFVRNSYHFVEKTKHMELTDTDTLVSFDVESLFTNIPVKETLNIIENKLNNDTNLIERTKLPVDVIMELLTICTEANFFEIKGKIFRQDEGMAMGSPLSPVFANIYMEWFEQEAIASSELTPKIWLRYVDDTFAIWSHGSDKLDLFLNHLNNQAPTIKFTIEKENRGKLAFLDIAVERHNKGLKTTIHRKKTHTGRYLNFKSNQSKTVKESVAYSLFDRAKAVCHDEESLKTEIKNITDDLIKNGYPTSMINKCKKPRKLNENLTKENEQKPVAFVSIPYIPNVSEKIRRIARKYNIKTSFKTENTLRHHLTKVKPENKEQASKNCIYEIPCECNRSYIGETKRPLHVRLKEHKYNITKGNTINSKLAYHAWENSHKFKLEDTKILHHETHFFKRKFLEGAFMKLKENPISQSSIEVRPLWLPLLREQLHFKLRNTETTTVAFKETGSLHPMELRSSVVTRESRRVHRQ